MIIAQKLLKLYLQIFILKNCVKINKTYLILELNFKILLTAIFI